MNEVTDDFGTLRDRLLAERRARCEECTSLICVRCSDWLDGVDELLASLDRDRIASTLAQHVYAVNESDDGRWRERLGAEWASLLAAADAVVALLTGSKEAPDGR